MIHPLSLLGYAAALLIAGGISLAIWWVVANEDSPPHKAFLEYAEVIDKLVRLMYMKTTGLKVALQQLAVTVGALVFTILLREPLLLGVAAAAAFLPKVWLENKLAQRRSKIEEQLDAFLVTLANALKVSPSLGDALRSTAGLIRAPIKEDIEFALKEYNLGTPLDVALLNMSARVESRTFASALATILIGRQTGGDLPKVLEKSAATLREMARLEGVVRTKTAEGKGQAYVLGAMPFAMCLALNAMDPQWLKPLYTSFMGYIICGIAVAFWSAAIIATRKILNVDI